MAEFDLASVLAQSVSNLDTGREAIEYIPRQKIHADPGNFYSMEGIDQLAANIELCGLMDPIRIRADGDGYKIVSGHRRFAAMTLLAEAGNEIYSNIPCIIDASQVSEAMQELRLIYANSDTRKLSSADLNKQVERVTELLYKLQEEGVSFPGRMRDHVAEACKLSKSKIARLNAIKNGLCAEIMPMYEKNELNESSAYRLASMSPEEQQLILTALKMAKKDITARWVDALAAWLERVKKISCKKSTGGTCSNCLQKMVHRAKVQHSWNTSCDHYCCANCDELATCKNVCYLVADKQLEAQAKRKKKLAEEQERSKTKKESKEARDKAAIFFPPINTWRIIGVLPPGLRSLLMSSATVLAHPVF